MRNKVKKFDLKEDDEVNVKTLTRPWQGPVKTYNSQKLKKIQVKELKRVPDRRQPFAPTARKVKMPKGKPNVNAFKGQKSIPLNKSLLLRKKSIVQIVLNQSPRAT